MKLEKIQEVIKKYQISLVEKDGQEGLKLAPPKSAKIMEEIKAAKPEIITELKRQQEERKARMEAIRAESENKTQEYLKTADLRRCLVVYEDEFLHREHYIVTLAYAADGERAYKPERGGAEVFRRVNLQHETETMKQVLDGDYVYYGIGGAAWEITPEQEETMIAEQEPAQVEADRLAAREKAAKEAVAVEKKAQAEAELQAKFDEAKGTGKPVLIRSYTVPCCDPREECSTDVVTVYAMPDGTTKTERQHTW